MAYTKVFERPYSGGWVDYPSETTLITADALNEYDETFQHVEDYLEDNPIADANATITNDYWNNSTTYAVGDIVIYLNGLYRCIVANTGQNPTNAAYWEATSLTDILKNVKTKTVTGTTTASGNISLGLSTSEAVVLSARTINSSSQDVLCLFWVNGGSWYLKAISQSLSILTNEAVTVYVYYQDL